jgi:hypothetical protein
MCVMSAVCRRSDAGHPLRCLHAYGRAPPLEAIREWKELEIARNKEKGYERTKRTESATGKRAAKNCNEEYVKMMWMRRDGRE